MKMDLKKFEELRNSLSEGDVIGISYSSDYVHEYKVGKLYAGAMDITIETAYGEAFLYSCDCGKMELRYVARKKGKKLVNEMEEVKENE